MLTVDRDYYSVWKVASIKIWFGRLNLIMFCIKIDFWPGLEMAPNNFADKPKIIYVYEIYFSLWFDVVN